MHEIINDHLEKILQEYTKESDRDNLLKAKEIYFQLTGVLHEEDEEFEAKMERFNFWYLYEYTPEGKTQTPVQEYVARNIEDEKVKQVLTNLRHSLFEFVKVNFKKQMVLKDLISGEKICLPKNHPNIGMLEEDIFSCRIANVDGESFLVGCQCLFPQKVKGILKKQAKKIGKLNNVKEEEKFLLVCEHLKTKGVRYGHIDLEKIFVFDR